MSDSEGDSKSQTVVKTETEEKNSEEKNKKRTWTPARQAAWQKCLEGRKEYIKTRSEIQQKEDEEKSIKQKVREEIVRKRIRQEIEAEMAAQKNQSDSDSEEGDFHTQRKSSKTKENGIESKPTKRVKKVLSESETESEESDEDSISLRRKHKKAQTKAASRKREQSATSFSRFAFV
jgi:hypothetical protein